MKKPIAPRRPKEQGDYHPGNLTCDTTFKQDEAPPMSERVVVTSERPILYDAHQRPIYRKAGFR